MPTFTVRVNGKEVTFTSKLSDTAAVAKLQEMIGAKKLVGASAAFAKRLLQSEKMTEKQVAWVHKLVHDASDSPKKSADSPTSRATEELLSLIGAKKLSKSNSDFALDLVCQARKKPLTERQKEWVNRLVVGDSLPERLRNPRSNRMVVVTVERAREVSTLTTVPDEWRKVIAYYKKLGHTI